MNYSYSEEQVKDLLERQRQNCLDNYLKNLEFKPEHILNAPEPTMEKNKVRELTKNQLKNYKHYLTVGSLKKFIQENNLPDNSPVVVQRIEDFYFNNNNWGVYLKKGEHAHNNLKWNEDIKNGKYLDKDEYPNMKEEDLILYSEEEIKDSMEQYHPAWSCVKYLDEDGILFIDLHY